MISNDTRSPEVRYVLGNSVYVEALADQHWVARSWGFQSSTSMKAWDLPAFQLTIQNQPSTGFDRGTELVNWKFLRAQELPRNARGACHVIVELASTQLPISVRVHTELDGTSVYTRWLEITNNVSHPVALTGVSPWSGRLWSQPATVDVGYSSKPDVFWEGWFKWKRLAPGINLIRQEHGLAFDHPYFILRNENQGEYFFGELEWPLNRVIEFDNSNGIAFRMGLTAANALRVISLGETVTVPAMHLGHIQGNFDSAVQAMHDHIRRSVLTPPDTKLRYRIQVTLPEDQPMSLYQGKQCNAENVKKFLDVMAELGTELFILDGPTWCQTYGEWLKPKTETFPNGLKPVIDYAHGKNLLFGIYVEPEGGRKGWTSPINGLSIGPWKNTSVYQQHPDWFLPAQMPVYDWQGAVLDLANPAAAEYMESVVKEMVRYYGFDLYRHDINTFLQGEGPVTERDGFIESNYWRHYHALNQAFDHVRQEFPNLILQEASGGGSRLDLGTLRRFSENTTSDNTNFPHVIRSLSGLSVYLPPETLITPIGMAAPEQRPDLDTMLRTIFALGNTPSIFNALLPKSTTEITPEIRAKYIHYTQLYKRFIRPILPTVQVYHHAPVNGEGGVESGDWFAMEFLSPDRERGWATVIRLSNDASQDYLLKPSGLDPGKQYTITFDSDGRTETGSGDILAKQGIIIRPGNSTYSELLLFEAK
jgi:alpha-galactosidase